MSNVEILQGNVLDVIKTLPDQSVNCVVTSPPYWGLRAYGTNQQIWQRKILFCENHQWEEYVRERQSGGDGTKSKKQKSNFGTQISKGVEIQGFCLNCGAWKGELGQEPTPELFVEHIVTIFREVRRVLRNDGTLWINLGDSFNGSGGSGGDYNDGGLKEGQPKYAGRYVDTLKQKDLVGIPWMVAFALRSDGWYLRMDNIWNKPNPMPESVTDRPTKSHEYIFLLSKSAHYYYNSKAILEPLTTKPHAPKNKAPFGLVKRNDFGTDRMNEVWGNESGRNKRSVWTVNTGGYEEAHFATFPEELIVPCVLAGCPKDGVVLDPFNGSGTTGVVAVKNGRNYIGIELNPEYIEMAKRRIGNALADMGQANRILSPTASIPPLFA